MLRGEITVAYDMRISDEYHEVLARPAFGFARGDVERLLQFIERAGVLVPSRPLGLHLPDPDDEPFVEVAVAAGCKAVVTGTTKHFAAVKGLSVRIMTPAAYVERMSRPPQQD